MREYFKYTLAAISLAIAVKLTIFYTDPMHEGWGALYLLTAPIITVAFLWPGMVATRDKEFEGFITGKLATAGGVRIAAISGGLNGLFDYLYYSIINKPVLPHHLAKNIAVVKASKLTEPEIKNSIGGLENFFTPFMQATFPMFITITAGFFFTVVFAYFIRRYRPGEKSSFSNLQGQ